MKPAPHFEPGIDGLLDLLMDKMVHDAINGHRPKQRANQRHRAHVDAPAPARRAPPAPTTEQPR
jgi:hypothetical protein